MVKGIMKQHRAGGTAASDGKSIIRDNDCVVGKKSSELYFLPFYKLAWAEPSIAWTDVNTPNSGIQKMKLLDLVKEDF